MMNNLELSKIANEVRKGVIKSTHAAKSGHPGGSLSVSDIMTYLYFEEMYQYMVNHTDNIEQDTFEYILLKLAKKNQIVIDKDKYYLKIIEKYDNPDTVGSIIFAYKDFIFDNEKNQDWLINVYKFVDIQGLQLVWSPFPFATPPPPVFA